MIFELHFQIVDLEDDYQDLIFILKQRAVIFNLEFMDSLKNEEYIFFIRGSEKDIVKFCEDLSLCLPLSLNFQFHSIRPSLIDLKDFKPELLKNSSEVLDAVKLQMIVQKNNFKAIQKYVKQIRFQNQIVNQKSKWQESIEFCVQKILDSEIIIKTSRGNFKASVKKPEDKKEIWVLFCDLASLKVHMRVETKQLEVLASFEKPSTKLMSKEIFSDFLGEECECILPYDLPLVFIAKRILELGKNYIFLSPTQEKATFSYEQKNSSTQRVVVSKEGYILYDTQMKAKNFQEILLAHQNLLIQEEKERLKTSSLILFLSKDNPMLFWLKREKLQSILDLEIELNPKEVFQTIQTTSEGKRLLENFSHTFPDLTQKVFALESQSRRGKSFYEFLNTIGFVLGYENADGILRNAKKYLRDKGPRIDFKLFKDEKNILRFDEVKCLKSCMSFRIAGVDPETLSYGILDSLGEFIANFIADMMVNFSTKSIFLCGSFLIEKIFLDRILHYTRKDIDLILPQKGFLDY